MRRCRVPWGYTQRPEPPFLRVAATYGDEENARIYAVHLTTANQSEIRRAYLVSVMATNEISSDVQFVRHNLQTGFIGCKKKSWDGDG